MTDAMKLALGALRKAMQGNLPFDEAMTSFNALKQAIAQPAQVPAGYKLVPIEPPEAMCQAGQEEVRKWPRSPLVNLVAISQIYKAMIAAAPEVKP